MVMPNCKLAPVSKRVAFLRDGQRSASSEVKRSTACLATGRGFPRSPSRAMMPVRVEVTWVAVLFQTWMRRPVPNFQDLTYCRNAQDRPLPSLLDFDIAIDNSPCTLVEALNANAFCIGTSSPRVLLHRRFSKSSLTATANAMSPLLVTRLSRKMPGGRRTVPRSVYLKEMVRVMPRASA